uniref:Uncharacterized protein n=1 Tax=Quercus lobata TaxID=97700 RepID=A0A7N2M3S0_QUELO
MPLALLLAMGAAFVQATGSSVLKLAGRKRASVNNLPTLWPAAYLGLLTAGCWHGPLAAAALIGFTGPLSAIGSILAGIDYTGLDHVMVFANGGLLPSFGRIIKRAVRLETQKGSYGVAVGVGFACTHLTATLHQRLTDELILLQLMLMCNY